jgi:ribosomal protein S18 acetylase RimI-like enzyme
MTYQIRPIQLTEADAFNAALGSVARERRFLRLIDAPSLESTRQFVASNIERGNPQVIALLAGEVVGWCDICRSTDRGSEHVGGLGMGVLASQRGRGIGKQLILAALEMAAGRFRRVELEVYESNTTAIALYERVGFSHEGRRRGAVVVEGFEQDVLMMGLLFN